MATPLRILILEDQPVDAELLVRALRRAEFEPTWERVDDEASFLARLDPTLDVILADYALPQYDTLAALRALRDREIDVPVIIVSGTISDEAAVECMREGAADYLLKDRLGRLGQAITQVLDARRLRMEKRRDEIALWEQEQRLRLFLEQLPAIAWSTDRELRITSSLGAGLRALGLEPGQLVGQSLTESRGEDAPDFASIEAHHRALEGVAGSFEQVWQGRTYQAHVGPLLAPDGSIAGCIGVELDITDGRRQITEMSQQLWQAAKLATMGELAASVAHELNNPLATVSLRVEMLLGQLAADDPRRAVLQIVEQEVDRMSGLVANLLDFSRRSSPQISSIELAQELASALGLIQYQLRGRNIAVVQDLAPDLPLLYADRQHLRQLFLNLLTNASDAMTEGGTLTIRAVPSTMGTGQASVLIELEDTGMGIEEEDLPRVMEPFFTTKGEHQGTGLGLAICRRIVEEHHGTIEITSRVGSGTTVRVALPIRNGTNRGRLGG